MEVQINSFRIPSMSMHVHGLDGQCIAEQSVLLQVHTDSGTPIARSSSAFNSPELNLNFGAGTTTSVAFLREAGKSYSLKAAFTQSSQWSTSIHYNENCIRTDEKGGISIKCQIRPNNIHYYGPCTNNFNANLLTVNSNCKYMQSTNPNNWVDGFCLNLGSI